mgnify:CR=1 FL=1
MKLAFPLLLVAILLFTPCVAPTCPDGQYTNASSCTPCLANCNICTSGTNCSTCAPGYSCWGFTCVKCVDNCKTCITSLSCVECMEGYTLSNDLTTCSGSKVGMIIGIVVGAVALIAIIIVAVWLIKRNKAGAATGVAPNTPGQPVAMGLAK